MSYFLTEEQQEKIDTWLDEQNKQCIDRLLDSENYPESIRKELTENRERGVEVPPHSPDHGYYSISFTPTPFGNRIYAHHHINGTSEKIFDMDDVKPISDAEVTFVEPEVLDNEQQV